MIEVFFWTTGNNHKVTIFLEEAEVPYICTKVNIGRGEQFNPDFLKISPNNRVPAIIDHAPKGGGQSVSVFESGAILQYLAEKTGKFLPGDSRGRVEVMQWLFWQMAGLGPMLGQNHHFSQFAPEKIPYAIERYVKETTRLYAILDKRLSDREYITDEYSIADMACYPWIIPHENQGQDLENFPNLKRWFNKIRSRPAVKKAYAKSREINTSPTIDDKSKKFLFGQTGSRMPQ